MLTRDAITPFPAKPAFEAFGALWEVNALALLGRVASQGL